jgi:hypothetical protein
MSYDYKIHRAGLFTEDGIEIVIKIRDNARHLLEQAGAFQACKAWEGVMGDSWTMLAALDYLVEKGELRKLTKYGFGQDQIFVGTHLRAAMERE